jgi:hypothetical protein
MKIKKDGVKEKRHKSTKNTSQWLVEGKIPKTRKTGELEGLEVRDPDMDDHWRPTRNSHFRATERIRSG